MDELLIPIEIKPSDQTQNAAFFKSFLAPEIPVTEPGHQVQIIGNTKGLMQGFFSAFEKYAFPFRNLQLRKLGRLAGEASSLIPLLNDARINDTVSIILGADSNMIKACYDALQFADQHFSVALMQPAAGDGIEDVFIDLREPWLHRLSLLGTQAHRSNDAFVSENEQVGLNCHRLGAIKHDPSVTEPDVRNADLCGIDLNVMKHCEAPFQQRPSAIGMEIESVCQVAYYAGRAERSRILCIYGFHDHHLQQDAGWDLLASVVWYFLHGLEHRPNSYPPPARLLNAYVLEQKVADLTLTFYKDESNQKWWLKSPYTHSRLSTTMPVIACNYRDYALAANEQMLSDRLGAILELYRQAPPIEIEDTIRN